MNNSLQFDKTWLESATPATPGLIGVDEAGRGALAGPVSAGAVYVLRGFYEVAQGLEGIKLIKDSKKLSAKGRQAAYGYIKSWEAAGFLKTGYGEGPLELIEEAGIMAAIRHAMQTAIERAQMQEEAVILIDGPPLKGFFKNHQGVVRGDAQSAAIAMASIVAKVLRDQYMESLHVQHPPYGLAAHKGYGTQAHCDAIRKNGPHKDLHRSLYIRNIQNELF